MPLALPVPGWRVDVPSLCESREAWHIGRQCDIFTRSGKECFRFWQEGPGFDRNLFSSEAIAASLEYIHNNPVSRDLCRRAVDWKWSSARYYLDAPPR